MYILGTHPNASAVGLNATNILATADQAVCWAQTTLITTALKDITILMGTQRPGAYPRC